MILRIRGGGGYPKTSVQRPNMGLLAWMQQTRKALKMVQAIFFKARFVAGNLPTIKAMPPLSVTVAAIASSPPRNPPFAVRNVPIMSGPKYPPRFAIELITAMPAAADKPLMREV